MSKKQALEYAQWLGIIIGICAAMYGIYTNWRAHRRFTEADAILDNEISEQDKETLRRFYQAGYNVK